MKVSGEDEIGKMSRIYLLLSELRYLLHREGLTLGDYEEIAQEHYREIAQCAKFAAEILPADVVEKLDTDCED